MIDRKTIFDQPVKNDERKYNHIRKLKMVKDIIIQLLICSIILFEMKAIDLDKQQEADADTKAKKKKKKKERIDWKSRSSRKYNNVFRYRRIGKNNFIFLTKNCDSIGNLFGFNGISI